MERETRFTTEIVEEAAERLEAIKDGLLAKSGPRTGIGLEIVHHLGWSEFALGHCAEKIVGDAQEVLATTGDVKVAFNSAVLESLLTGGIAADICYERSMGLKF